MVSTHQVARSNRAGGASGKRRSGHPGPARPHPEMRRASALDLTEGFPHQGAMLGVKDRLAHPTISARVDPPFRQVHPHSLATTVQLFDLSSADGTWRVFGTERPRHGSSELRYPHWFRRPHLVGHFTPNPNWIRSWSRTALSVGGAIHDRAGAGVFPSVCLTQAGHIQPTASERHRPVSASISSLSGRVRKDRPGPLRRHAWQITHSEFMVPDRIGHRSRRGLRTGADRLRSSPGSSAAPSEAAARDPSSCG